MKADGQRKFIPERILDVLTVSPDGRWIVAGVRGPDAEHMVATTAFATDGSAPVTLCLGYCVVTPG